jgi:class 3 adenylate cyclase
MVEEKGEDGEETFQVVCRSGTTEPEDGSMAQGFHRTSGSQGMAKVHPDFDNGGAPTEHKQGNRDNSIHTFNVTAIAGVSERPRSTTSVFDMLDNKGRRNRAIWKRKLGAFLDGVPFTIISIIFTILILYVDLMRAAIAPAAADPYFLAWTIFAITAFVIEIVLSSVARRAYFLRFYFWMDIVASFSLLCDVPGFMDFVTNNHNSANHHVTLQRAAKAAQAGARAARIMQVIAVIQLLRYKAKRASVGGSLGRPSEGRYTTEDGGSTTGDYDGIGHSNGNGNGSAGGANSGSKIQITKPQSRIGEKVTEMTMRKVILGVLLLLLVLPVFDANVYYGHPTFLEDGGLVMLHDIQGNETNGSPVNSAAVQSYIQENQYKLGTRETGFLYKLIIRNQTVYDDTTVDLRKQEYETSTVQTPQCNNGPWDECFISKAWVDIKWTVRMQALLDIGRVTFILSVLSLGALLFIRDTDEMVLQPIERMVDRVKLVSENPLALQNAANISLSNPKSPVLGIGNDKDKDKDNKKGKGKGKELKKSRNGGKPLETRVLEHSIAKICSLLSVGFGEAGAEVIADNIRSGGDLNPMVPGRKVRAIFGFCDIRSFTEITEVLQEGVMEFVNSIASIVHTEVSLHAGAPNKNIGDAFLLVWKFPESGSRRASVAAVGQVQGNFEVVDHNAGVTHLADAALASFIIIQSALKRSAKLQEYSGREDLNARLPGFSVRMGFGLHVGWAIEGAIGSTHKIDASYLSPHVNMASRLEAATKQFGVPLLLSEMFVKLLSPNARQYVRQIDCVTVKGSKEPVSLYTVDMDLDSIHVAGQATVVGQPAPAPSKGPGKQQQQHRASFSQQLTQVLNGKSWNGAGGSGLKSEHVTFSDYPYFNEFSEHPDIIGSLPKVEEHENFKDRFAQGLHAYVSGDWKLAATIFEETRVMRKYGSKLLIDGPSEALLKVLKQSNCIAPVDWQGYRALDEK